VLFSIFVISTLRVVRVMLFTSGASCYSICIATLRVREGWCLFQTRKRRANSICISTLPASCGLDVYSRRGASVSYSIL